MRVKTFHFRLTIDCKKKRIFLINKINRRASDRIDYVNESKFVAFRMIEYKKFLCFSTSASKRPSLTECVQHDMIGSDLCHSLVMSRVVIEISEGIC